MSLKGILEGLVKGIVQTENSVYIMEKTGEVIHGKETIYFKIRVKPEEIPLLVGKKGSTIIALRVIMSKLAGKQKKMVFVDLDEED